MKKAFFNLREHRNTSLNGVKQNKKMGKKPTFYRAISGHFLPQVELV